MSIEIKDIHWIAGFLEGEGTFGYYDCNNSLTVQAPQVQKEPLERLQKLLGGRIQYRDRREKNPKWSPCYIWDARPNARSAGIMMTLYPLMSPKRKDQIKKALFKWRAKGAKFGDNNYSSKIPGETIKKVIKRYLDGELISDMAKDLNMTILGVSHWIRGTARSDINSENLFKKVRQQANIHKKEIRDMFNDGLSRIDISKKLCIDQVVVNSVIKKDDHIYRYGNVKR